MNDLFNKIMNEFQPVSPAQAYWSLINPEIHLCNYLFNNSPNNLCLEYSLKPEQVGLLFETALIKLIDVRLNEPRSARSLLKDENNLKVIKNYFKSLKDYVSINELSVDLSGVINELRSYMELLEPKDLTFLEDVKVAYDKDFFNRPLLPELKFSRIVKPQAIDELREQHEEIIGAVERASNPEKESENELGMGKPLIFVNKVIDDMKKEGSL